MHSGTQSQHVFTATEEDNLVSNRHRHKPAAASVDAPEPSSNELVKAGEVLVQLAERHKNTKHNGLAEVCYLRALDIFSKSLPSHHPLTATTRDNLATLYRARGQLSVAESLQRTALADLKKHYGKTPHPQMTTALRNLAETCLLGGKVQEGLSILSEAVQMSKELSCENHEHVVEIGKYHAQVMSRLG